MELLLSIHVGDRAIDVVVGVDRSHTVADLTVAIAAHTGAAVVRLSNDRSGRRLDPQARVVDVDVLSGDVLVAATSTEQLDADRSEVDDALAESTLMSVDVVAGPDAGRSFQVRPGRVSVGRSHRCDLMIDDASVSRHHLDVEIGSTRSVIHPNGAAVNGVTVNDEFVETTTDIGPADVVGIGSTRLAFRPVRSLPTEDVDQLGQIEFRRTPYRPPTLRTVELDSVGPVPERPEARRFQFISVVGPLVMGIALYLLLRNPMYLLFTLLSPIMMIGNVVDDRRSGRRRFRHEVTEFRAMLNRRRGEISARREAERVDRLRSAPDLADLVRRAEQRTIDLWPRGRNAPDLLAVRLGLAPAAVRLTVEIDDGSSDLRHEALAALAGLDTIDNMPVLLELDQDPVVGIHGESMLVDGVVSSLICQIATMHSPQDVVIAAAVSMHRPFGWLKWLPHLRSVTSPLDGEHIATDAKAADALINRLIEIAAARRELDDRDSRAEWPRVVVLIDSDLTPDPAQVSRLLDLAAAAAIRVIWIAPGAEAVNRQATRVLALERGADAAMMGRLWSTSPEVADVILEVEHLRSVTAERAARALAPVRDASTASRATAIPRVAPLLGVLGISSADDVAARWRLHEPHYGLPFSIGLGPDGPLSVDLVDHGPHTLIGGTSGSGKSELVQSMVAGLAANHSPDRLNFLFIDYKGGASSQMFADLPHTVGSVTNLSLELSLRALTSLRAELNRRMALMEGKAKDLATMLQHYPAEAPASLVIVIDEFATLVKEVPEFVDGIVDIAQRGRSLGIHLVLATQRPSGSVNENILANTNLRISLRMLERSESTSIIDTPDAAEIPVPLRGRGFVRLGPRELVEFQSAFAGAPVHNSTEDSPILVAPFERPSATARPSHVISSTVEAVTHLDAIKAAIVSAYEYCEMGIPRRPWREVLPSKLSLAELANVDPERHRPAYDHPGRFVVFGLADAPEEQTQPPAIVDLETGGGWLVFGTGGAGKTTLLRTVAASIGRTTDQTGNQAHVLAIDFGSRGLQALDALAHVIDVAAGDDLETVTRNLALLDEEIQRRRSLLAHAGAENLTAYVRDHAPLPRIVLMIDDFGALADTLFNLGSGMHAIGDLWADRVQRIIIDGRQVGVHAIVTADRRNAVPSRLHTAIANRLILRHADPSSYSEYGIPHARSKELDLEPGRGLIDGSTTVQIALVSTDDSARAQAEAIRSADATIGARHRTSYPLPDRIPWSQSSASRDRRYEIGVADLSGTAVEVDLTWSHFVVAGPARSGRSMALAALVRSVAATGSELTVLGPASSPLRELGGGTFGASAVLGAELDRLAAELSAQPADRGADHLLVIDDLDQIDDPLASAAIDRLLGVESLRIAASMETRSMSGYSSSRAITELRQCRRLLVLSPDDPTEFYQMTGVKMMLRPGLDMVPGRGVVLADRIPTVIQTFDALTSGGESVAEGGPTMSGVVDGANVPTLGFDDKMGDRGIIDAEGEPLGARGLPDDLTDHPAVHHRDGDLIDMLSGDRLDPTSHAFRERVGGLRVRDRVVAPLGDDLLGDRMLVGEHLTAETALPVTEKDLA